MDDMSATAREQLLLTLDLAAQLLHDTERHCSHLKDRAAHLRTFLEVGEALLGLPPWDNPPPPPPRQPTAAQTAKAILDEVGYALSVQQMMDHLAANGTGQSGMDDEKQREALRGALRSHPSMFRRVERGIYALTAWGTSERPS